MVTTALVALAVNRFLKERASELEEVATLDVA